MAEIIRLGSLYFDNLAQEPGAHYKTEDGTVSIRDTVEGKALPWLKLGHMLVAQQCVCLNVSWERLNKDKLIYGAIIKIDGQDFLCRSMSTSKHSSGNEWDKFIRKYGHSEVDVHEQRSSPCLESQPLWRWTAPGYMNRCSWIY